MDKRVLVAMPLNITMVRLYEVFVSESPLFVSRLTLRHSVGKTRLFLLRDVTLSLLLIFF